MPVSFANDPLLQCFYSPTRLDQGIQVAGQKVGQLGCWQCPLNIKKSAQLIIDVIGLLGDHVCWKGIMVSSLSLKAQYID